MAKYLNTLSGSIYLSKVHTDSYLKYKLLTSQKKSQMVAYDVSSNLLLEKRSFPCFNIDCPNLLLFVTK